jgi:hypothetical protein
MRFGRRSRPKKVVAWDSEALKKKKKSAKTYENLNGFFVRSEGVPVSFAVQRRCTEIDNHLRPTSVALIHHVTIFFCFKS